MSPSITLCAQGPTAAGARHPTSSLTEGMREEWGVAGPAQSWVRYSGGMSRPYAQTETCGITLSRPRDCTALNRAIAITELDGPGVALAAVDRLEDTLAGYHPYHAARADLPRRLRWPQESRAAYDKAIELVGNTAETAYLTRRRDELG